MEKRKFICYFYEFDSEMRRCIDILKKDYGCIRVYTRFDGTMWRVKGSV